MFTFPFGMPIMPVRQADTNPKRIFVLGVYASAMRARWVTEGAHAREAARASEDMSGDLSWALEYADRLDPLVGEPDARERVLSQLCDGGAMSYVGVLRILTAETEA